jgi:hypothetical protein
MTCITNLDEGDGRITLLRKALFNAGAAIEDQDYRAALAFIGHALENDTELTAPWDWLSLPDPDEPERMEGVV